MQLARSRPDTSLVAPLEKLTLSGWPQQATRLIAADAAGQVYLERQLEGSQLSFLARGKAGEHTLALLDEQDQLLDELTFTLSPRTEMTCDKGPYARLFDALQRMIISDRESHPWIINGRIYRMLVCWSRDHVYTLKAAKYFMEDVTSGLDYWLESQTRSGMFWDCIYPNENAPAPTWTAEALGKGYFRYDDDMKYSVRRVPVLADTEYCWTEGVWYAWKASGDDAWMAKQLPRLEKALKYMTTDPDRWSRKEGLVHRSFTADEWDFANPHYCAGDHRVIHKQDPKFLFHGNNSGLYAMYWRMAEMYEHLGNGKRADELRNEGEALRKRANKRLFFGNTYGHMIPSTLPEKKVYDLVGDERKRMSLSLGYTINRGLPTHEMAVKIIREYQRRRDASKGESFAEWWTMDPSYEPAQWPAQHTNTAGCPQGEYMNGGICPIIAGEISKAAFDHGFEGYGADILERTWELTERDGGHLHQVYKRLPADVKLPKATFQHVDLSAVANRGLRYNATKDVEAWTSEGVNDMRNLPTGRQTFGAIEFQVIEPEKNAGRAVLRIAPDPSVAPATVTIPVGAKTGRSIYFLHALAHSVPRHGVAGTYDILYADGTQTRIYIREGHEISLWWGLQDSHMNRGVCRRAWWGANGEWKNVGLYMFGWDNPHPDKPIAAIRVEAVPAGGRGGGILLAAISLSDREVAFEQPIRSYGLPDCWAQAAVYYALAEGLAGIEDRGSAFSNVRISPRWSATEAQKSRTTLHYPASDGYCTCEYTLNRKSRSIILEITGSFQQAQVHCLLPAGAAKSVVVAGEPAPFRNSTVEKSRYVDFELFGLPTGEIVIRY